MTADIDLEKIDTAFRDFVASWLNGRTREALTDAEYAALFEDGEKYLRTEHGVELWDYLAQAEEARRPAQDGDGEEKMFATWRRLYEKLELVAEELNINIHLSQDFSGLPEISVYCNADDADRIYEQAGKLKGGELTGFSVNFIGSDGSKLARALRLEL